MNTFNGQKIKGLKKACSDTKCLSRYGTLKGIVRFNPEKSEIYVAIETKNTYFPPYTGGGYVTVCETCGYMTMDELTEAVHKFYAVKAAKEGAAK